MPFIEIEPTPTTTNAHTGATVGLMKARKSKALLRVTMRRNLMEAMGFTEGDRLVALLGQDEDHGVLRLRKDKNGAFKINERNTRNTTYWQVSLGHRPEFVDRIEAATACQWEQIDLATVEIIMPSWADETRPKIGKAISATPPSVTAGKKDVEAMASERAASDARRQQREAAEEDAAWSELKHRLDDVKTANFDTALKLTRSEKGLLTLLSDRAGRLVSKETLAMLLYADRTDDPPDEKIIDAWVCKIRPKIAPRGCQIETVWGQGFIFHGDTAALSKVAA